jgi:hypothetical protein
VTEAAVLQITYNNETLVTEAAVLQITYNNETLMTEAAVYRTPGEHANHYTTDAVH